MLEKNTSQEIRVYNSVTWNTQKTVLLHKKGLPKQLAQTPLSRYLEFPYGVPKAGRGLECPPAGWEKAVFWQGTQHFLHPSQKGTQELSGCKGVTVPEWDLKPNGKGLVFSESFVG